MVEGLVSLLFPRISLLRALCENSAGDHLPARSVRRDVRRHRGEASPCLTPSCKCQTAAEATPSPKNRDPPRSQTHQTKRQPAILPRPTLRTPTCGPGLSTCFQQPEVLFLLLLLNQRPSQPSQIPCPRFADNFPLPAHNRLIGLKPASGTCASAFALPAMCPVFVASGPDSLWESRF
jgi:hypothetical protein